MGSVLVSPSDRHKEIKPLPKDGFKDWFIESLAANLHRMRFVRFNAGHFQDAVCKKGLWPANKPLNVLGPDEHLFRYSSYSNSSFFVFVKKTKDSVVVFFYNPMSGQNSAVLEPKNIYMRREFREGDVQNLSSEAANEIQIYSGFKKETRMQLHNHMGYSSVLYSQRVRLDYPRLYDDGETYFLDFIRAAMLHHLDVVSWTPHNWKAGANERTYELMKEIFNTVGIIFPSAVEISAPLKSNKASGPHMLVVGTANAMKLIQNEILARRDPDVVINSCYRGMTLDDMLRIIEPLRRSGKAFLGFPHPWNDASIDIGSSRILRLESTGLLSAVDTGEITLERAVELLRSADFIGAFNPTLTECGLDISNTSLKTLVETIVNENIPGAKLTANAVNLAIAQKLGKNSTYDPDDHRVLPLSSKCNAYDGTGFLWGGGHTIMPVNPSIAMTEASFIRMIREGAIRFNAHVFRILDGGMPVLAPSRTHKGKPHKEMDRDMERKQNGNYVSDFLATLGKIGAEAFDIISE
jgi:hypothetical protein